MSPNTSLSEPDKSGPLIVLSERLGEITEIERRLERELHATLEVAPLWTPTEIRANARRADAIVIGAVEPFDADVLRTLSRCRLLVRRGVGCNNVDLDAATELGIPVAYVPDASVEEVSDHALTLMLALERRVVPLDALIHRGGWRDDPASLPRARQGVRRLNSLTLGVVGLGRIGRSLVRKSKPLFGRILCSDPEITPDAAEENGATLVTFEELVAESDLISLHAPLTAATTGLFGAREFAAMHSTSHIVNTSRGALIDEAALVRALQSGQIASAALDVTEQEPLANDSPLLSVDGLILTGHSAAHSRTSTAELRRRAIDAVSLAFGHGQQPPLANPEVMGAGSRRIALRPGA